MGRPYKAELVRELAALRKANKALRERQAFLRKIIDKRDEDLEKMHEHALDLKAKICRLCEERDAAYERVGYYVMQEKEG